MAARSGSPAWKYEAAGVLEEEDGYGHLCPAAARVSLDASPGMARHNASDIACWRHAVTDDIDVRRQTAYTLGGCLRVDWRSAFTNSVAVAAATISSFDELRRLHVAHARGAPPMAAHGHAWRNQP